MALRYRTTSGSRRRPVAATNPRCSRPPICRRRSAIAASGTRRPGAAPMATATSRAWVSTASTFCTVSAVSRCSSVRAVGDQRREGRLVPRRATGGGDQLVGRGVHAVGDQVGDLAVRVELQRQPGAWRQRLHDLPGRGAGDQHQQPAGSAPGQPARLGLGRDDADADGLALVDQRHEGGDRRARPAARRRCAAGCRTPTTSARSARRPTRPGPGSPVPSAPPGPSAPRGPCPRRAAAAGRRARGRWPAGGRAPGPAPTRRAGWSPRWHGAARAPGPGAVAPPDRCAGAPRAPGRGSAPGRGAAAWAGCAATPSPAPPAVPER